MVKVLINQNTIIVLVISSLYVDESASLYLQTLPT